MMGLGVMMGFGGHDGVRGGAQQGWGAVFGALCWRQWVSGLIPLLVGRPFDPK